MLEVVLVEEFDVEEFDAAPESESPTLIEVVREMPVLAPESVDAVEVLLELLHFLRLKCLA